MVILRIQMMSYCWLVEQQEFRLNTFVTDFNFNITELSGKENILKQFDNVNYKIVHFINHQSLRLCICIYGFWSNISNAAKKGCVQFDQVLNTDKLWGVLKCVNWKHCLECLIYLVLFLEYLYSPWMGFQYIAGLPSAKLMSSQFLFLESSMRGTCLYYAN